METEDNVEDSVDLYSYLTMLGLKVTEEECGDAFERLKESEYFVSSTDLLTEVPFLELIDVWEKDNVRYALWSNKKIEVEQHTDIRYNFLDKGNLCYDDLILLWEPDSSEKKKIREHIDNLQNFRPQPYIRKRDIDACITKNKASRQEEEDIGVVNSVVPSNKKNAKEKKFEADFEKGVFTTPEGSKVNNNKAEYNGLVIGIGEFQLRKLYSYAGDVQNTNFEGLYKKMIKEFIDGLFHRSTYYYRAEDFPQKYYNKVTIRCGAFPLEFRRRKKKDKTKFFIDRINISRENIEEALYRALYYGTKEEFHQFLKDIQETPIPAMALIESGLKATIYDYSNRDNQPLLHWDIKKENNNYILYSGDKEFTVNGGYKRLLSVAKHDHFGDKWKLYVKLKKSFDNKDILEIMKLGLKDHYKREKRAKSLLDSTIKNNSRKIKPGNFNTTQGQMGGRTRDGGWFIQGIKNKYFLSKKNQAYFVTPKVKKGKFICIYAPANINVHIYDKIVSTMLALLNDKRIEAMVHTLRD